MPMFWAKSTFNSLMYKQNKSLNHINHHETDKLFTINNPSSLFYIYKIHNDQVQIVTFYRNLNMF